MAPEPAGELDLRCPTCGRENQAAAHLGDATRVVPAAGDVTICAGCASLARVNNTRTALDAITLDDLTPEHRQAVEPFLVGLRLAQRRRRAHLS